MSRATSVVCWLMVQSRHSALTFNYLFMFLSVGLSGSSWYNLKQCLESERILIDRNVMESDTETGVKQYDDSNYSEPVQGAFILRRNTRQTSSSYCSDQSTMISTKWIDLNPEHKVRPGWSIKSGAWRLCRKYPTAAANHERWLQFPRPQIYQTVQSKIATFPLNYTFQKYLTGGFNLPLPLQTVFAFHSEYFYRSS